MVANVKTKRILACFFLLRISFSFLTKAFVNHRLEEKARVVNSVSHASANKGPLEISSLTKNHREFSPYNNFLVNFIKFKKLLIVSSIKNSNRRVQ